MAQPLQRPAPGVVRYYNFLPEGAFFLGEVLAGLAQARKTLPPKYFFDAHGCALFERICALPGHHAARAELALMRAHGAAMAKFLGPGCQLIELGNRPSPTTRILTERLQPPLYVPIGMDATVMRAEADALARLLPWLNINGVCADHSKLLTLPEFVGVPIRKKAVYCSGSTAANLSAQETLAFMQFARRTVGSRGALLIGVDSNKDKPALDAAYNDAAGVTAAFNLNLLARINRELGGDFQLQRFRHRAFYDVEQGRVEMHIDSLAAQFVHVGGERFHFGQAETMLTGISCRYEADEFRALAQRAGFAPAHTWTDAAERYSVHGMIAV